jgi:hypothetical protein
MTTPFTPADLADLRRIAEAATAGPWEVAGEGAPWYEGKWAVICPNERNDNGRILLKLNSHYDPTADSAHIAAFDPPTALRLLAQVEALEAESAKLREFARNVAGASLLALMQTISEDHYCAGWLTNLEFRIWARVTGDDVSRFGLSALSEHTIQQLRDFSEHAGGWWIWRDQENVFIPLNEWCALYAAQKEATVVVHPDSAKGGTDAR